MAATPHSPIALHGVGLSAERVEEVAIRLGLPRWRPGVASMTSPTADKVLVLLGSDGDVTDEAMWGRPFAAWVEERAADDVVLAQTITRARAFEIYAHVSTATANQSHLAGRLVHALAERVSLTQAQRDDMELAMHEAISNAVVHGNLEVAGMKGLSITALDQFSLDIAQRMGDPAFAGRRIEVAATVEEGLLIIDVADEGTGFVPTEGDMAVADASGRGLDLIAAIVASYELLDGGRRIRMRFGL